MKSRVEIAERPYELAPYRYSKTPSNPMAGKTATGRAEYGDQDNWDHQSQQDWSGGIGGDGSEGNSAAFVVGDARFSGQVGMAPFAGHGSGKLRESQTSTVVLGPGGSYSQVALEVNSDASVTAVALSLMLETPDSDVTLNLEIYEATGSADETPTGSVLFSTTVTVSASNIPGIQNYQWFWDFTSAVTVTYSTLVIRPDTDITVSVSSVGDSKWTSDDSTWSDDSSPRFETEWWDEPDQREVYFIHPFDGGNYPHSYDTSGGISTGGFSWNGATPGGYTVDAGVTDPVLDAAYDGTSTYVVYGSAEDMRKYSGGWSTLTGNVKGDKVEIGGGFLWRSLDQSIFYSSDESTWTEIAIRGTVVDIFHFNQYLYYVTKNSMGYIGSGDVPIEITRDHSFDDTAFIVEFQGTMYIANKYELLEFDGSSIRNVSPTSRYALPREFNGRITAVFGTNSFLYLGISADDPGDGTMTRSGVYAWNGSGWSCIYLMGGAFDIYGISVIDGQIGVANGTYVTMLLTTEAGHMNFFLSETRNRTGATVYLPTTLPGPYTSGYGVWLETHWATGGLKNLPKDWNALSYAFERTSPSQYAAWDVSLYYKGDENSGWTLLSTDSYTNEEVVTRKYLPTTLALGRPAGARLKLGLRMVPTTYVYNDIELVKLKETDFEFHAMLRDRWRWNITVLVEDDQVLASGTMNPYDSDEMIEHLEGNVIQNQQPFKFMDLDGTEYWVKLLESQVSPVSWEMDNGVNRIKYHVVLVLDQVRPVDD